MVNVVSLTSVTQRNDHFIYPSGGSHSGDLQKVSKMESGIYITRNKSLKVPAICHISDLPDFWKYI